jgi:hypothetical protein
MTFSRTTYCRKRLGKISISGCGLNLFNSTLRHIIAAQEKPDVYELVILPYFSH